MRKFILAATVILPLLGGAAVADDARMSQTEVVRAARCVAFADLGALQSDRPDTSALAARVRSELANKPDDVKKRAAREGRRALIYATQADTPQEVQKLKDRRDRLCSEFISAPIVAQNSH
jgi:hypothetical protein